MFGKIIRKLFRKKQINCVRCKLLVTVPKSWYWLKPCPKCKSRIDQIADTVQNLANGNLIQIFTK